MAESLAVTHRLRFCCRRRTKKRRSRVSCVTSQSSTVKKKKYAGRKVAEAMYCVCNGHYLHHHRHHHHHHHKRSPQYQKKKKNGRDVTFPSSSVPVCNRHAYAQSPLMHIKIPCPFMVKSRSRTERPAVYVGEEGGFCSLR